MSRMFVAAGLLAETFQHFRDCGEGRRECQVLWTSPWDSPDTITNVVHSRHRAHAGGFNVDDKWLNEFWMLLAKMKHGVRVQVHTHPVEAFHSDTDDAYPMVQSVGFLSLVIPNFGTGAVSLQDCYLCEMDASGLWRPVRAEERLEVTL